MPPGTSGLNFTIVLYLWTKVKIKLSLWLIKNMPWRRMGECRYSSTILDLGTRWRWVIRFTLRQLYPRKNRPRYPLDRRLGRLPEPVRTLWSRENACLCREWTPGRPADRQPLYQLSGNSQYKNAEFPSEFSERSWYVCCTVPHNSIIKLYRLTLRWVNSFIAGYLIPEGSLENTRHLIACYGLLCVF
jgi:hypothetical protein